MINYSAKENTSHSSNKALMVLLYIHNGANSMTDTNQSDCFGSPTVKQSD